MNTITDVIKPELPAIQAILSLTASKDTDVAVLAQQEIIYLEQQAVLKPEILECEKLSIILAVKSVLRKNLSIDPTAGLVYVKTRSVKINNQWKKVLEIEPTANGLLSENRQLGLILDFTNPAVQKDETGKVIGVEMELLKARPNMAPRWEKFSFDESDFLRWRTASHKERARGYKQGDSREAPNSETLNYANILYTSWKNGIDPEFARAKCIRHSLKKLGTNPNENISRIAIERVNVVDPNIATEEANDTFAAHEEVSSELNNNNSNVQQAEDDEL